MPTPNELRALYQTQAAWFAAERNRLLRKAGIARCRRVLDLGTGTGELLENLDLRAAGFAIGADADIRVLRFARGKRVACDARMMPFANATFDLVFTQMFFLWAKPLDTVLSEIRRVLADNGCLVAAAEPDYGGAIEHPSRSQEIQKIADELRAEGADVRIGRKLAQAMDRTGFQVECGIHPADPLANGPGQPFQFTPYFHFVAKRSESGNH
ncbi:MAG: methyltransferase domain-containing protein [Candidatus Hydrogenedentes bacterium]|nr:methyltransferase domain-containing protein [Candidatus Hydrogenedentota bacterium]